MRFRQMTCSQSVVRGTLGVAVAAVVLLAQSAPLRAERLLSAAPPFDAHVAEAAQRFNIPERWIRAVIRTESAGNQHAVSSAGALGLMQLMPGTWADLQLRYGVGSDPFEPRDNILAGTAYLREMHERYGSPGFLAAYNAGPGRYEQHLQRGIPLPTETRLYLARLTPMLVGDAAVPERPDSITRVVPWTHAPLFSASLSTSSRRTVDDHSSPFPFRPASALSAARRPEGVAAPASDLHPVRVSRWR